MSGTPTFFIFEIITVSESVVKFYCEYNDKDGKFCCENI